jgi:hypothetical protein
MQLVLFRNPVKPRKKIHTTKKRQSERSREQTTVSERPCLNDNPGSTARSSPEIKGLQGINLYRNYLPNGLELDCVALSASLKNRNVLWESKDCLRASHLCSKNSLDIREFDYVTCFKLFLAALDHDVIHPDCYLVFGSSDKVAILGPIDQGRNAGSEPAL